MKPAPDHDASCSGREPLTRQQANDVAKRLRARAGRAAGYRCDHCGSWHVGVPNRAPRVKGRR